MSGNSHLCGQHADLVGSHVWPRFVYKRYVSGREGGGAFVDLTEARTDNKHCIRPWFCEPCDNGLLGEVVSYAADFCTRLEKQRGQPQDYTEDLLRYATSISWGTAKVITETGSAA